MRLMILVNLPSVVNNKSVMKCLNEVSLQHILLIHYTMNTLIIKRNKVKQSEAIITMIIRAK